VIVHKVIVFAYIAAVAHSAARTRDCLERSFGADANGSLAAESEHGWEREGRDHSGEEEGMKREASWPSIGFNLPLSLYASFFPLIIFVMQYNY
jgi:hypothetical protein